MTTTGTVAGTPAVDETAGNRARFVKQLREVADLIESGELPTIRNLRLNVPLIDDFDTDVAQIAGVAAQLGASVVENEAQVGIEVRTESGGVYHLYKTRPEEMARHQAMWSYRDNIRPDEPATEKPDRTPTVVEALAGDPVDRAEVRAAMADVRGNMTPVPPGSRKQFPSVAVWGHNAYASDPAGPATDADLITAGVVARTDEVASEGEVSA